MAFGGCKWVNLCDLGEIGVDLLNMQLMNMQLMKGIPKPCSVLSLGPTHLDPTHCSSLSLPF